MVRAVDGEIEIPGSSRAADNSFFFVFSCSALAEGKKKRTPHLRKAELFFAKNTSAFFEKSLHKLQIR